MEKFTRYFEALNQLIEAYVLEEEDLALSIEALEKRNEETYQAFAAKNYGVSYANPDYCCQELGEVGSMLSMVFYQCLMLKDLVYYKEDFTEPFLQYLKGFEAMWHMGELSKESAEARIREFSYQLQEYRINQRIFRNYSRRNEDLKALILDADLSDPAYLYRMNICVTENERRLSEHLGKMDQKEMDEIASMFADAYLRAYPRNNLQRAGRESMGIVAIAGLERLTKALILEIQNRGFEAFVSRVDSTSINKQLELDHKADAAVYLSEEHMERLIEQLKQGFERYGDDCRDYSGTFHFVSFGEAPFEPQTSTCKYVFTDEQAAINQKMSREFFKARESVIPEENRNFSIIGFPVPEIHSDFEAIFNEFLKINNLSNAFYEEIQKKIIDALDQGTHVLVQGYQGNQTDIQVQLQPLSDPATQTGFFNCGADANIPVGEVFTSPSLKGTNGWLHIKDAFIDGLSYQNLRIRFEEGYVAEYSCTNFETEEEGKAFVKENLLFPNDRLPMGEFAIGTNTLAYAVSKKYDIVERLHVLFIEKMGPHFAVGDTCYSMIEEIPVFNPDGKEIVAKDNEHSLKRLTNMDEAYTDIHEDITIPYEDIKRIASVTAAGVEIDIIRHGRFVLEGTECLNEALEGIVQ